ncbi:MAG: hypothetical protein ACAI25_17205 [Planctomycetota bacterium]
MSENVNPAAAAPNGETPKPTVECGKSALNEFVTRTRHSISGVRLTVERCPDASMARTAKGAAVLGGAITAGSFLLKRSKFFMIAAGVGGLVLGALGSRYHISFDWDPDRAFGGEKPQGEYR